jgi:hypothetical protein
MSLPPFLLVMVNSWWEIMNNERHEQIYMEISDSRRILLVEQI